MRTAADGDEEERLRRRARTGSYTALAGVVGFTVCLLVRFSTVLPRWDLLAMLAVVGVGAAIRMHALRARVLNSSDPARQLRPDAPSQPPGFRAEQRLWWPRHKSATAAVVFWLCAVPVTLLALTSSLNTSVLDRVRGGEHMIAEVTVMRAEIDSYSSSSGRGSTSSHYQSTVVANTRADGSGKVLEGKTRWERWNSAMEGDRIWALYLPHSTTTDAVFDMKRSGADVLAGGWTKNVEPLVPTLMPLLIFLWMWRRLRTGKTDFSGQDVVAAAVHTGRARGLRVRVSGAGAASVNKGRVLKLAAPDGERDLLLDRWADLDHVANSLSGQSGWLYWARTVDDTPLPALTPYGRAWNFLTLARLRANTGPRALDSAALVLADGRYLRGRTPRALDGPMAAGQALARRPPHECPEALPVEQETFRAPRFRPLAVAFAIPALVALVAMATVPLGGLADRWELTAFLLWLVVMIPGCASHLAATRRSARK